MYMARRFIATVICVVAFFLSLLMLSASLVVVRDPWDGMGCYLAFVAIVWVALEWMASKFGRVWENLEILVLSIGAFVLYVCVQRIMLGVGQVPGAMPYDPALAMKSVAAGRICSTHPLRNVYWCNYEIFISAVCTIFGGQLGLVRGINAFVCASAVIPFFSIARRISESRRIARFSTLLLIFCPAICIYTGIPTGEMISAVLMFVSSWFLFSVMEHIRRFNRCPIVELLIGGGLLGTSFLFKSITIVYILAMLVCCVIFLMRSKRSLALSALTCFLIFFAHNVSRNVGQVMLAELGAVPSLSTAQGGLIHELLYELSLGFNLETKGCYNNKLAHKLFKMSECERKEAFLGQIRSDWRSYPKLMVEKFINIHGSHNNHHGAINTFKGTFKVRQCMFRMPNWIGRLTDLGTVVFRILFVLGVIGLFIALRTDWERCIPGIFALCIVIEFTLLHQLIEANGRYRFSIYPFYFLLLPYAGTLAYKGYEITVRAVNHFRIKIANENRLCSRR